jgi:hypothetical protein
LILPFLIGVGGGETSKRTTRALAVALPNKGGHTLQNTVDRSSFLLKENHDKRKFVDPSQSGSSHVDARCGGDPTPCRRVERQDRDRAKMGSCSIVPDESNARSHREIC